MSPTAAEKKELGSPAGAASAGKGSVTAPQRAPLLDRIQGRASAHRAKATGDHLFDADLLDEAASAVSDLLAALHKICEPITVAAPLDVVTACQDLHELIVDIAQTAIAKAGER